MFHICFFNKHFNNLKRIDLITEISGYISYHILIEYYCIYSNIKSIQSSYKTIEAFKPFLDQQSIHINDKVEYDRIYNNLRSEFFKECITIFKKNLTNSATFL